ncbi:Methyltransferase domain-containing protein [Pedobacter sp. ok626]|uniref:methyltransferase domain-containing protein n=1 Tax=Pedobacter sp. ok626 TaxID=1761882 RepID=UPI0008917ABE|nr:methyltransferase domain-containing protein [Pedobacter sp. ok626]SDK09996.1 Methyltransferase domain-containing protein [Pedobacter sp. ok626]
MLVDTSRRSDAPELMDDFLMEGDILTDALDKIASINRLLGGNKVTLQGVKWLLKSKPVYRSEISILDVGCGNGDMLRTLAKYAKRKRLKIKLVGMDANYFSIKHAEQLSTKYPNISYVCADIFEEIKQERLYDVILCTLTLHHFKDDEIITLMNGLEEQSALGIVVNDLHRNALAYYLFVCICFIFRLNHMSRNDGLVSILRGFRRQELHDFSKQLSFKNYILKWKWAFRYQWIIRTI